MVDGSSPFDNDELLFADETPEEIGGVKGKLGSSYC